MTEDRDVRVRELPLSVTPLAHPFYWSDRAVMDPIAGTLARAWEHINLGGRPGMGRVSWSF